LKIVWWAMKAIRRTEAGETLLEVIMALVVIGLVVSAYFATFSTQSSASTTHRNLVTADGVLRGYAETIKAAVRDSTNGCGKLNPTTFTASYTPPSGFTVSSTPGVSGQTCPPATTVQLEHLTVSWGPNGMSRSLDINVRTP